ncbi:MAG: hypothetical protein M1570_02295 [Chloroflexi bacterium]|nr:hypothetical protein [Chloroflexota bacterium]
MQQENNDKVPIGRPVAVADGVLEVSVTGGHVTVTWKSRADPNCSESITMRDGLPETSVYEGAGMGLSDGAPRHLMAYRDRLVGVHAVVDEMLEMYQNHVYLRRTSRGSGPVFR